MLGFLLRHHIKGVGLKFITTTLTFMLALGLMSQNLFAKSSIISPIPPPQEKILDIDEHSCSDGCLKKLYTNGYIFSFLAKFNTNTTDKKVLHYFSQALAQLSGIEPQDPSNGEHFRIALLIPKQMVGRYSVSVANTILAYLIARNIDFDFQVFDSIDESKANLESTYLRIIQSNANFVIAMLGPTGVQNLIDYDNLIYPTYIPTINKERLSQDIIDKLPENLYFGGISYKEQFQALQPLMQDMPLIEYADDSQIGSYLTTLFTELDGNIIHQRSLSNQEASQFNKTLQKETSYFPGAALILNTSAPKTGLILSQIELNEDTPRIYLSTQINFSPIILQLASPKARENLFVASSIGTIDTNLMEYASLLNTNLRYDWVSYATSLGVEFGLRTIAKDSKALFSESMRDKQIQYQNRIWTTKEANFILAK